MYVPTNYSSSDSGDRPLPFSVRVTVWCLCGRKMILDAFRLVHGHIQMHKYTANK